MITKVEQQAAFDKMMQGLNPAQKKAVDNMEGPLWSLPVRALEKHKY